MNDYDENVQKEIILTNFAVFPQDAQGSGVRKKIALVAHDNKKRDLLEWAQFNRDLLAQHELYATGTTGKFLEEALGAKIIKLQSGPLGGDQHLAAVGGMAKPGRQGFRAEEESGDHHQQDGKASEVINGC